MMTSYFKEQDPNFSLLFDSQEQAESYIETFKAAKTEDGAPSLRSRSILRLSLSLPCALWISTQDM